MKQHNGILAGIAALLVALTAVLHLASAAKGYSFYRDQHLGGALLFARDGIDLLHPRIVGFAANDTPAILEFPLWQALAAVVFKVMGSWFGWANLVSLLIFATAAWPLVQLAKAYGDERKAWWTLVFFLAQPLTIFLAGTASTDGLSLVTALWFLYCAQRLIATGRWGWLVAAAGTGAVAAVTKLPFFFAAGVTSVLLLAGSERRSSWALTKLAGVGAFAAAVFLLWTRHADAQMARAEFPLVDLRMSTNPELKFWYFGDWAYRLNPANWIKGAWRLLNTQFGSFALAGLAVAGFVVRRNPLARASLAAALLTTAIFSHLVLHHSHYYALYSAAFALLCAEGAVWLEKSAGPQSIGRQILAGATAAALLLASAVQGLISMEVVSMYDPYPARIVQTVTEHTRPEDKLLVQGGGWGGRELILAGRNGLSVWNTKFLSAPENLARIKALGFTKYVMISESPLMQALQMTNPGGADRPRTAYPAVRTPVDEAWPVVFQSDDVLIVGIP